MRTILSNRKTLPIILSGIICWASQQHNSLSTAYWRHHDQTAQPAVNHQLLPWQMGIKNAVDKGTRLFDAFVGTTHDQVDALETRHGQVYRRGQVNGYG